jgi:lauroyl/myristoyl acyltransferase
VRDSDQAAVASEAGVPAEPPWIDATDLLRAAALMFVLAPMSWAMSPRRWWSACRVAGAVLGTVRELQHPGWSGVVPKAVGTRQIAIAPRSVRGRTLAHAMQAMLQLLRDYRRPGWRPDITLEGREQIERALDRGRGVVLWVHRFHLFAHFMAIHRAGFSVCRASGMFHGHFYRSRFGRRWLNPIQTGVENRYCERIVVRSGSLSHLREIQHRLRRNAIVSLYFDAFDTTRNIEVPFLDGRLRVAPRAVTLARQTGATLLPVFTVSDRPDHYRVIVGAPVDPGVADGRRREVDVIVAEHVRQLEPYVLVYPDQWSDWWRVQSSEVPPETMQPQ